MRGSFTKIKSDVRIRRRVDLIVLLLLSALALLSTAKLFILGLTVDEEYAVTMAWRNAVGDGMFRLMWEPHQTSGFICTALIRAFIYVTGSTDHLVIFLRVCGFLIELLVSAFVYTTLRKRFSVHLAFAAALLSFLILPKWMLTPDFSNILIWSSLCLEMCIFRLYMGDSRTVLWSIMAGIFTCMAVLAYPSCILAVPFIFMAICHLVKDKKSKADLIYLITCVVIGLLYVGSFLVKMPAADLVFGIKQMLSDGSHSSAGVKLAWLMTELKSWIIPFLIIIAVSGVIYAICQYVNKEKKPSRSFLLIMLTVSIIYQMIYWLIPANEYFNRPLLCFYIAFIAGIWALRSDKTLIRCFFIPNLVIWACVMLVTNTGIRVTGAFLMPCIVLGLTQLSEEKVVFMARLSMILMLFMLLMARGYLVIENGGYEENYQYVKQKALSGPAESIYCMYNDGYAYNAAAGLLAEYGSEGDVLLVAGSHSLWYMLGNHGVGTYSTISTPTFDERLLDYYDRFPEKRPNLVIGEEDSEDMERVRELLGLEEPLKSADGLVIYRLKMV